MKLLRNVKKKILDSCLWELFKVVSFISNNQPLPSNTLLRGKGLLRRVWLLAEFSIVYRIKLVEYFCNLLGNILCC